MWGSVYGLRREWQGWEREVLGMLKVDGVNMWHFRAVLKTLKPLQLATTKSVPMTIHFWPTDVFQRFCWDDELWILWPQYGGRRHSPVVWHQAKMTATFLLARRISFALAENVTLDWRCVLGPCAAGAQQWQMTSNMCCWSREPASQLACPLSPLLLVNTHFWTRWESSLRHFLEQNWATGLKLDVSTFKKCEHARLSHQQTGRICSFCFSQCQPFRFPHLESSSTDQPKQAWGHSRASGNVRGTMHGALMWELVLSQWHGTFLPALQQLVAQ